MSATLVHSVADHATVILALGQLKSISPQQVWHGESRINLRFEYGSISMSADSLEALVSEAERAAHGRSAAAAPIKAAS